MAELDLGDGAEQMTESTPAASDGLSLEATLQEELELAAPLVKQAGRLLSALKGWQKAASVGNVLARDKHAQQALALGEELAAGVAASASHWAFDTARYLDSSRWREELTAVGAGKHGLKMTFEGDYLLSPPVVVRAR